MRTCIVGTVSAYTVTFFYASSGVQSRMTYYPQELLKTQKNAGIISTFFWIELCFP